jgi:TetR/AcrR family transcriptional regulator, repressor of fatR-cypB operon
MPDPKDSSAKRTAILEAALDLIAVNGFHATPTSLIAQKAGVGIGSIYRYFKSKEDLIQTLFTDLGEKSSQAIMRNWDAQAPIRDQYIRLMQNTFHYLIENPKTAAFLEQYFNSPFGLTHKRDVILDEGGQRSNNHPLHAILDQACALKITKDLPLNFLFDLTFGPIILLVRDIHAGLITIDTKTMDKIISACWDAVKR